MAVLLQQVVPAQYAFVLHTADPLTGKRCRCLPLHPQLRCWQCFEALPWPGLRGLAAEWGSRSERGVLHNGSGSQLGRASIPLCTVLVPRPAGQLGELHGELVVGMGEALVGNYPGRALSFAANGDGAPRLLSLPGKRQGLFARAGVPHLIARSDSNGGRCTLG